VSDVARDNAIRLEEGKEATKIQFGENDKVMYIEKGERELSCWLTMESVLSTNSTRWTSVTK